MENKLSKMVPVYFDIETTGLDITNDRIIEIAACCGENRFSELVNPTISIPPSSEAIHSISNEMVKDAETFDHVLENFIDFCNKQGNIPVLVAHNGDNFDFPFIRQEALRTSIAIPDHWKYIDSIKWAKKFRPDLGKFSLQFIREAFDIPANTAHRALDDAIVLRQVFECLVGDLKIESIMELLNNSHTSKSIEHMPFGKHQGKKLAELPKNYVQWLFGSGALEKPENQNLKSKLEEIFGKVNEHISV